MKYKDLLNKAISFYGVENQLNQATEECGELIVAINKLRRAKFDIESRKALASEVADVIIMMDQVTLILGEGYINEALKFKKNRLKERLNS